MTDAITNARKDDFHRERSRFLDAFAGLEEAILRSGMAKDAKLKDALKALRAVRNDLVHSQFRFVQLEGQLHAVAVNSQEVCEVARQGRLLKIGDFELLQTEICKAKREIEVAA